MSKQRTNSIQARKERHSEIDKDAVLIQNRHKCYLVGGAVRDTLLGLTIKDKDYVVVGSTPQEMLNAGFLQVGRDFPVFLHPKTKEQYALARSERKTGSGYKGFSFNASPNITLEQDLLRRDLTINAMAQAVDENYQPYGPIIDPYGGILDLKLKMMRHVSSAFAEDPVRLLRIARFTARFKHFSIAPETKALMKVMVANGEIKNLVPERIWQEFSCGLMENYPARMMLVLHNSGALYEIIPELLSADLLDIDYKNCLKRLQKTANFDEKLEVRFLQLISVFINNSLYIKKLLIHEKTEKQLMYKRLAISVNCMELGNMLLSNYEFFTNKESWTSEQVINLFYACDAWRRPTRFEDFLKACSYIFILNNHIHGNNINRVRQAYLLAIKINMQTIVAEISNFKSINSREKTKSTQIGAAIRAARISIIDKLFFDHRL